MTNKSLLKFMEKARKTFLEKRADIIKNNGYVIQGVDKEDKSETFMYTIGLGQKTGYDILLIGLPHDRHGIIIDVIGHLNGKVTLPLTEPIIIEGAATCLLMITQLADDVVKECVLGAIKHSEENGYKTTFLQCFWPDVNDLFPSQPNCKKYCSDAQDVSKLKIASRLKYFNPRLHNLNLIKENSHENK